MNTVQVARLCTTCGLGTPVAEPRAVAGGLLHHMWHLTTDQGMFAIKQLNPAIMRKPGILDSYRLTEQIATDMANHGIPAIAARACGDNLLQTLDDATFIVYPWIEGETLPLGPVEPARARLLGLVLGRMHALDLHYSEMGTLHWRHFHPDDWDILTFQAADQGLSWTYPVRAALPYLLAWGRQYEEVGAILSQTLVVSHRDLDQKNVLWRDAHTPMLIDWEAAGLINPTMEVVGLALEWSGQTTSDSPREDTFMAVLEGYRQAGGILHNTGLDAIHGFMGNMLGWLLFNMRRSLGESISNEEERQLGIRETISTLAHLRALAGRMETWAAAVDKLR